MTYEAFLHLVSKPARYVGMERNAILKDHLNVQVKTVLCFPEVYELGMAHLGLKILYHLINQNPDYLAERCFAPWPDMEQELRKAKVSLLSLESQTPLREFDLVGFSLQSELTFTNLLNVLNLSGIPLISRDRTEEDPIILAGGPVTSNPEPFADFIDAILIGDGEQSLLELLSAYSQSRKEGLNREDVLLKIAAIPGFYVPRFYHEVYDEMGAYQGVRASRTDVPSQIVRRYVEELEVENYPQKPVVAQTPSVQDRHVVEVVRGCTQGCRFCQAGYIYRPIRELSKKNIVELTKAGLENTGYEEVGLVSLSTADYSDFPGMVDEVSEVTTPQNVSISLPSLRADSMSVEVADSVKQVKQTGFTFAPEAGSQRLRRVINKNISNEELFEAIEMAFKKGWNVIKLYFMVGLPTETDEDLLETVDLIREAEKIAQRSGRRRRINVSFGPFIPKAHTPFQWDAFIEPRELRRRISFLRSRLRSKTIHFKWDEPETAHFEAVVSRGNRSISRGLLMAFQEGQRFEGWSEHFDYKKIMGCFEKAGVQIDRWCSEKSLDEILPWDHIDARIKKKFLTFERKKAFRDQKITTSDCRWGDCHYCGVPNPRDDIKLKAEKPTGEELERRKIKKGTPSSSHRMKESRSDALRFRLKYSKTQFARFLAHSDVVRLFQMGMKAARFPNLYSKGFTPRPVMQFGPVLPLGVESLAEVIDLWLLSPLEDNQVIKLNENLPRGLEVRSFQQVALKEPSLSICYPYVRYSASMGKYSESIREPLKAWELSESWPVEHRGREIDLKRAIRSLDLEGESLSMVVSISSQDGHNANPILVMEKLLGISAEFRGEIALVKECLLTC
jgi:radical SAM family uncharacterized protein/radical SAM-linked protein